MSRSLYPTAFSRSILMRALTPEAMEELFKSYEQGKLRTGHHNYEPSTTDIKCYLEWLKDNISYKKYLKEMNVGCEGTVSNRFARIGGMIINGDIDIKNYQQ